jgi:hypothetical protein
LFLAAIRLSLVVVAEKEIAVKRIGTRSHSDRVTNPVIKRAASANVSYSFELRRQKDYLFLLSSRY